ncbi:MAG TPA: DUF1684 domain-containing protein [Thermoanaerobaculia bacterium]|nr:DUF1684 domain-containing protein [Thermoanaerobaculia bacterium]
MKRFLLFALLGLMACKHDNFAQDETKWRDQRHTSLTGESSWLTLVGLHWLQPGTNDVTIAGTPPLTVRFVLTNGVVTVEPNPSLSIGGKPVTAPVALADDTSPNGPTIIKADTRSMQAIKRNDKFAIRAKDTQSAARREFKGLDYFPPNEKYRVEARFEPYNPPKKIPITNVLGMTSDETSPGALVFTLDGTEYRLDPILEQGTKDLFVIFKDKTAGHETYGAARYLYASPPADGKTIVDFNHAYNPPCAFTPYATCPLPPPQNRLPIRIEAGEKKYAGGHA